jgi:hypothetical protein
MTLLLVIHTLAACCIRLIPKPRDISGPERHKSKASGPEG